MIINDINRLTIIELEVLALRCGTTYEINDGRIIGINSPAKAVSDSELQE